MTSHSSKDKSSNRFRIIGGQWRSRKLSFPGHIPSLRLTPDRVRETLFNWLQIKLPGANCLDLFTGSGSLALEALSRQAASVTAIDMSPDAISTLRSNCALLKCENLIMVSADSLDWLRKQAGKGGFDIIFLDPPYSLKLIPQCLSLIDAGNLANEGCVIYMESDEDLANIMLPAHWQLTRNKKAGQVFYGVCERVIT